jgi:hypothetical protein
MGILLDTLDRFSGIVRKRSIHIQEPDGTVVVGSIIDDQGQYIVEIPLSTPHWYTLWLQHCRLERLEYDDHRIIYVEPSPNEYSAR